MERGVRVGVFTVATTLLVWVLMASTVSAHAGEAHSTNAAIGLTDYVAISLVIGIAVVMIVRGSHTRGNRRRSPADATAPSDGRGASRDLLILPSSIHTRRWPR